MIWKELYSDKSAGEHGTLYQLRNLLHRRNVVKHPKKDVNASEDFFLLVVTSHVLAAAVELLQMESLSATPQSTIITTDYWCQSLDIRKSALMSVCTALVKKFVNFEFFPKSAVECPRQEQEDKVFQYASKTLSLGLFYIEYLDAIHEGDGDRLLRCWRYLLPMFKASRRTNYSLEVLHMLYQSQYSLSPRLSHQLLWSRCVNTRGLPGHNIPCDLFMEHLNRLCKEAIAGLRANQHERAVIRVGKAIGTLYPVVEQFDKVNSVASISGAHFKPVSAKDLQCAIVALTKRVHAFKFIPGRQHKSFKNHKPLLQQKPEDLIGWMNGHIAKFVSQQL